MKKTLISVLLIVSLLSTALFSVVFAAYSVEKTATATAIVSAFGIQVAITDVAENAPMAPNGSGTLATIDASGSAKVKANISYTCALTITENDWKIDANGDGTAELFYCPITFTMGSATVNGANYTSATTLQSAIAESLKYTATVTGTTADPVDMSSAHDVTVTWTWNNVAENAAKDTLLTESADFSLKVDASIIQDTTPETPAQGEGDQT